MARVLAVFSLCAALAVTGCEGMSSGQKGAVTGGAIGTGIGLVTGGDFATVVGAGLIGGGVGYIVGDSSKR